MPTAEATLRAESSDRSFFGIVSADTRKLVQQWRPLAADPQYLYDLFNNTQMAVVRSQYSMFNYFKNCNDKKMLASLSSSRQEVQG